MKEKGARPLFLENKPKSLKNTLEIQTLIHL
jgi:hypothetical protein